MKKEIKKEIYNVVKNLGGNSDILSIIGSLDDTITEKEFLKRLKYWNEISKKTKLNEVSLWGKIDLNGNFSVTVNSTIAWLYSKDSKIADKFVGKTNRLFLIIEKEKKEKKQKELDEKIKKFNDRIEETEKVDIEEEKKPWWKFW